MKKIFLALCIIQFIVCTSLVFAEPTVYTIGGRYTCEVAIHPTNTGYCITTTYNNGDELELNTDKQYDVFRFACQNKKNGTDVVGEKLTNVIWLKGTFKRKKIEKKYEIDEAPWYQEAGIGLKAFIKTDTEKIEFWCIKTDDLAIAKIRATNLGTETIHIHGVQVETVKVKITIKGIPEFIFSGIYWLRKSDGQEMRNKTIRGTVELVEEKQGK